MYITDLEGFIRDNNFDPGIDSLTPNADIRIICQNPILRVNDGDNFNIGVFQDVSINDGDTVNLEFGPQQDDYYAILNRAQLAYEVAFQPLSFFADQPDPVFPLGRKAALRETRDQAKRIDLVFPDHSVSVLAWVEPKRLVDDFPLMHIKARNVDTRLFGEAGSAPTLIPHELTHALHFSMLTAAQRTRAQDEYADFIITSPVSGVGPFHSFNARTTPEVAFIEAGGFYGENFMEFMRARQPGASTLVRPEPITEAIQAEFVLSEWIRLARVPFLSAVVALPSLVTRIRRFLGAVGVTPPTPHFPIFRERVSRPDSRNRLLLRPSVTGGDVEGAIYSAIFVDFAATVGLDFAASSYFAANAITFGEYRTFINNNHPQHAAALETARTFWGL